MVTGIVLLLLATVVGGAPSITFPINSQVPPVARVAKPFNFVFSSFTFTSTTASMYYTLRDPPKWLQLDSASRTLSGTPGPGDVGAVIVTLTAADSTGYTDMASTLIVSASSGPSLGSSASEQLPSFGTTLNSTTLALYPSAPFSFAFKANTFLNTNGDTVFYAVSASNAPLPSWIHFDPASLTFSGNTPPSNSPSAPPEYFGIQLTASDVVGFSGAMTAFTIVVGLHELLFAPSHRTVNFTEGRNLEFTDLRSELQLDGKAIADQDLRQATADVPTWLSFDSKTLGISGTPPSGTTSLTISIMVVDVYGDIANTTVFLQSTLNLFSGKVGKLNATIGHDFTYTFSQSLLTDRDIHISVDLGKASSWLRYDSQTLTIQGHVPQDLTRQDFALNATASRGATTDSQTILLTVGSGEIPVTPDASSSLSSTTDATTSPNSSSASAPQSTALGLSDDGDLSKGAIAAVVLIPCLTIIGAVLLSLYHLRRRRKVGGIKKSNTRPLLTQDNPEPDPEMAEVRENRHVRAPSRPPRINWKPSTSKRSSHIRLPGESIDEESEIHESSAPKDSVIDRYSKYMKDTEISPHRPESKAEFTIALDESATARRNTLNNPRKRPTSRHLSAALTDMSQSRRNSRRTNRDSAMSFKSTSKKRMSGIGHGKSTSRPTSRSSLTIRTSVGGHGKGDFGPPNHGVVRQSLWSPRSTWTTSESGSSNYQESEITMQKTADFPKPPRSNTRTSTTRPGIRTVTEGDQTPTRSQKRLSACTARQSYLDNRARARHSTNPFLSAGSSSTRAFSHRSINPLSPNSLGGTTSRSGSFHPSEYTIHYSTSISREPTQRTQRSYSKSSSLDAPLRPRSRKISSPRKSIGARVVARLGQSRSPVRREQSPSKASVTGSSRFESAASSRLDLGEGEGGEDIPKGQLGKGKEREKEKRRGREEWRHPSHLNPLAANSANSGDISERISASGAPGQSRTTRTVEGEEKLSRLSQLYAPPGELMGNIRRTLELKFEGGDFGVSFGDGDGDGDGGVFGDGEGRARFVENENKGKRPTSVEVSAGGQSRNKSVRGNVGNVGNEGRGAFL